MAFAVHQQIFKSSSLTLFFHEPYNRLLLLWPDFEENLECLGEVFHIKLSEFSHSFILRESIPVLQQRFAEIEAADQWPI